MTELRNPHLVRFMAALGTTFQDYGNAVAVAGDAFAASARHLAPDTVQEGFLASCRECDARSLGTWHHVPGGRRFRAPSDHDAPAGGPCPGSFLPANLTEI